MGRTRDGACTEESSRLLHLLWSSQIFLLLFVLSWFELSFLLSHASGRVQPTLVGLENRLGFSVFHILWFSAFLYLMQGRFLWLNEVRQIINGYSQEEEVLHLRNTRGRVKSSCPTFWSHLPLFYTIFHLPWLLATLGLVVSTPTRVYKTKWKAKLCVVLEMISKSDLFQSNTHEGSLSEPFHPWVNMCILWW